MTTDHEAREALLSLARLGASFQHLEGLGIVERHNGNLKECTTTRCTKARATLALAALPDSGAGREGLDVERLVRAMEDVFPGWLEEAPGTAEAQAEMRSYAEQLDVAYRRLADSASPPAALGAGREGLREATAELVAVLDLMNATRNEQPNTALDARFFQALEDVRAALGAGSTDEVRLLDAVRAYGDARADVAYGRATRKAIDLAWDWLLLAARIPPMDRRHVGAEERLRAALKNERDIIAAFIDHAPDAFCDLTGARHKDLVERRVIRAAAVIRLIEERP